MNGRRVEREKKKKKLIFKLKISYINTPLWWSSLSLLHIEGNFLARFFFIYIHFFLFHPPRHAGSSFSLWMIIYFHPSNQRATDLEGKRERGRMCYVWEKDTVLSESCTKKTPQSDWLCWLNRIRKQQWHFLWKGKEQVSRPEEKGAWVCCCCSIFTRYPVLY